MHLRPTTMMAFMLSFVLAPGCGHPAAPSPTPAAQIAAPTPPPTPTPVATAPSLSCPLPIAVKTTGSGATVTFGTPPADGGQSPVSVACTPQSGTTFPLGPTEVRCIATDSANRTGSCVFTVSVERIPTTAATRFLAFGDSVTEGVVATFNPAGSPPYFLRGVPNEAYPAVLGQTLAARYGSQNITVLNEGKGGEKAVDGVGRASRAFNSNNPEAVLILDGYNDLSLGVAGIDPAIAAVNEMAKLARFRGARVFLATITPPPVGVNHGLSITAIVLFNQKLRVMAKGENAVLVDLYQAFATDPNRYLSDDGRHPNELGYRKIAETFFNAIRAEFEVR